MKTPIFYQLKGTAFRRKADSTDLIEVNEIFKNDNPIIARENAFNIYQNYIDVFLESKGCKYLSHEQTSAKLQDFFNSYTKESVKIGDVEISELEIDVDFDKGLNIYMVMGDSKTFTTLEGETIYEDKELIHYIDNGFKDFKETILLNLITEFGLYEELDLDMKKYKQKYDLIGFGDDNDCIQVLKTPISFKKYKNNS